MLRVKALAIDTLQENVAYLHRNCPLYSIEGLQALMKIEVFCQTKQPAIVAVLNIVDDTKILDIDELGLSS